MTALNLNGSANGASPTFRIVGAMSGVDHRRQTAGYVPFASYGMVWDDQWDKRFTWWDVPKMKRDPQILMGQAILESPAQRIDPIVLTRNPHVRVFIENTLKRIWQRALRKIIKLYEYGHVAGEVEYKVERGRYRFHQLHTVHPIHARALMDTKSREVVGVRVYNIKGKKTQHADLCYPNAFWCANNPEYGSPYAMSQFAGAREPWMEKFGRHGANDIRRLWFLKNAYSSGILRYPDGFTDLGNGKTISNQDLAREILEKMETGGILVLPNTRQGVDDKSAYLWDYEPPKLHGGDLSGIVDYPKELDKLILKGLRIPGDILEMDGTRNSWSGRSIPMLMFYSMMDQTIQIILDAISRLIVAPLVRINFGPKQDFVISHKSLAEVTYREPDMIQERVIGHDEGGDLGPDAQPVPGQPGQQPQPGKQKPGQGMYDEQRNPSKARQMPLPKEPRPRMARMSVEEVLGPRTFEEPERLSEKKIAKELSRLMAETQPAVVHVPPEQIVLEPVETQKNAVKEQEIEYDEQDRIVRTIVTTRYI